MNEFVIETKKLTKKYGHETAIHDVDLHVRKGRIYGLLGRNGAGKTTTMKLLLGLTDPTAGEVLLWEKPLRGNEKKVLPRIGSMVEGPGFYPNLTGTENLRIFATLRGVPTANAVENALRLVGLPVRDKKLFGAYSLGMKQRLGIANAVFHDPELLILDEPTNGLDPIGIAGIRDHLKKLVVEREKTILISSHILSEITLLADDIGIIDRGVLLEEAPLSELTKRDRRYIELRVSDVPKTVLILERDFGMKGYSVQDDCTLHLFDAVEDIGAVHRALVLEDVAVYESRFCSHTLEDYFKSITGGEGIA